MRARPSASSRWTATSRPTSNSTQTACSPSIRPSHAASPARKWLLAGTKGKVRAAPRLEPLPYAVALVALTDEQRAMLQLLLEGGQSYEDIGSLLGVRPDEVRSRARTALREMGGADPDARVGLSDYILGQADPIGRADAVRQLQADPEANALAQRLVQQLRLLAPKAQLPDLPESRGGRAPAPPPSPADEPRTVPPSKPPVAGAPAAPKGPGFASRAAGFFSGFGGLSGK